MVVLVVQLFVVVLLIITTTKADRHTSNYALIVDTSMNWFNYRHIANTLAIYHTVKAGGIPDSQIILMLAEDIACNSRNALKGSVYDDPKHILDLFPDTVQVDYRGSEVTVENVLRVLSGRHLKDTPISKRLNSNENSNVLVYFDGHGGDGFLKFRDTNILNSQDLSDAFAQMKSKGRFKELLFIVDTCQAATLFEPFRTNGIAAIGSSSRSESSLSYEHDPYLGIGISDRFTYHLLRYIQNNPNQNLEPFFKYLDYQKLSSTASWISTLSRPLNKVPISDFFGAVLNVLGDNSTTNNQHHHQQYSTSIEKNKDNSLVKDKFQNELLWSFPDTLYM